MKAPTSRRKSGKIAAAVGVLLAAGMFFLPEACVVEFIRHNFS